MRNPRFQISDSEFWETEMDSLIFMIESTGGCPSTLRNITKHVGMVSNSPTVSQHDFPCSMRFHGLTNVPWFRFLSRFYACLNNIWLLLCAVILTIHNWFMDPWAIWCLQSKITFQIPISVPTLQDTQGLRASLRSLNPNSSQLFLSIHCIFNLFRFTHLWSASLSG